MTTTMPAFVPAHNAPARIALDSVAVPEPKPNEALIDVYAYSVNRGETFLLESPRNGWRPGQDVAGRLRTAAADGSGPGVGSRVVAHAWDGGWAPQVAAATDAIAELPDNVPDTVAATLPLAGLTALRMVRQAGSLLGKRLLITGASGGVGHLAVELALSAGADVVAVCATAERGELLAEFGATVLTDIADLDGTFDVIMESVGGKSLAAVAPRLSPGGLLLWFGQASREPVTLDFFEVAGAAPNASIELFSYWGDGKNQSVDLGTLVRLVSTGRLHPSIGRIDDWRETPAALIAVRDRQVRGNAVLTIDHQHLPTV